MNPETGPVPALEIPRWSLLAPLLTASLVGYFRYARTATPIRPPEGR